jgi:uncharacterized protein YhhL (DUF1145 family)
MLLPPAAGVVAAFVAADVAPAAGVVAALFVGVLSELLLLLHATNAIVLNATTPATNATRFTEFQVLCFSFTSAPSGLCRSKPAHPPRAPNLRQLVDRRLCAPH